MNASDNDIAARLQAGASNGAIVRELRVDKPRVARIRRELGLPNVQQQPLTLEEKWATKTRKIDGGHVHWTGSRGSSSGTPVLAYRGTLVTAASVAFRIRTGREPVGYVLPECDYHHCVAPDHVEDEPGRQKTPEQLRYLTGGTAPPERCAHGHDQAVHGKFQEDGTSYCGLCTAARKAAARARETAGV
ncbi:hypothetical protein JI76_18260 [Streptomyces anulatus]|uniref:hypothetical protein n=1 Tax=Streptomyces anulatus TaxID=1892 RepID=UPI0006DA61DD|nr:hypothetical protein [Streptomyces anulatus]KPL31142.1 hypothetical protein JI76_18260 [Streptomyces anulatus]